MAPENLADWKSWSDRLSTGGLSTKIDFNDKALALDDAVVAELGKFYESIDDQRVRDLNNWLRSNAGRTPMDADEKAIRNLVWLFQSIGSSWGIRPFNSQRVKYSRLVRATADWSKLPPELAFLAEPAPDAALRFTRPVFSEDDREVVKAEATPKDISRFAPVAEEVLRLGMDPINGWCRQYSAGKDVEASLVKSLIGVLDALGLPYFD